MAGICSEESKIILPSTKGSAWIQDKLGGMLCGTNKYAQINILKPLFYYFWKPEMVRGKA